MIYGRDALRQYREQQAQLGQAAESQPSVPDQIPPDAPMSDAVLSVWNGQEWVAYDRWLATAPIEREEKPGASGPAMPTDATCVAGVCGGTKVWLVKNGQRWLMYAGSRKARSRRSDFASPALEHAICTAEQWYGSPGARWHVEKGRDGKSREAADLPPQDSTIEEETGERGDDDLGVDGVEPGR